MSLRESDLVKAVQRVSQQSFKIKIKIGEAAPPPPLEPKQDQPAERALANPEVQRFREVLGGEVRTVRNLKESMP
jgi:hypothetical protein